MAEEQEITILARDFITTYPRLREAARIAVTTYLAPDMPARTIRINLTEKFPGQENEVIRQITERKGTLFDEYIKLEDEAIRQDIQEFRQFRPEIRRIVIP